MEIVIPIVAPEVIFGKIARWDNIEENSLEFMDQAYAYAYDKAISEGLSEYEADEKAYDAQLEAGDRIYGAYSRAIESAADELIDNVLPNGVSQETIYKNGAVHITLRGSKKDMHELLDRLMSVASGYGISPYYTADEYLEAEDLSLKDAILNCFMWFRYYPAVYGSSNPESVFENWLNDYTRNL